ncbi:hypothetical protein KAI58_02930 [Candidatus Gracilibacteria bacterium]|nr:hypothetical protein [Candidatus Gracilibacteria bacterium]
MKKTLSILSIFTSCFLFGCDTTNLKTSVLGANSEEEENYTAPEPISEEIKIEKESFEIDITQENIDTSIQKPVEQTFEEFTEKDLISEKTLEKESFEIDITQENIDTSIPKPVEQTFKEFTEKDFISEKTLEKEVFEENIPTDEPLKELNFLEEQELFEEIEDTPSKDYSEKLEKRTIHAESMKNSTEPDISVEIDDSGELFLSLIETEKEEYHPNRSDLEDFYGHLQEKNKFISEKFSFFCDEECDSIAKAYPETVFAEIEYLINEKRVFLSCNINGCTKNEIPTNVIPDRYKSKLDENKEEIKEVTEEDNANTPKETSETTLIEEEELSLDENLSETQIPEDLPQNLIDQANDFTTITEIEATEEIIEIEKEVIDENNSEDDQTKESIEDETTESSTSTKRIRIKINE